MRYERCQVYQFEWHIICPYVYFLKGNHNRPGQVLWYVLWYPDLGVSVWKHHSWRESCLGLVLPWQNGVGTRVGEKSVWNRENSTCRDVEAGESHNWGTASASVRPEHRIWMTGSGRWENEKRVAREGKVWVLKGLVGYFPIFDLS